MGAGDRAYWGDVSKFGRVATGYYDTDSATFTTTVTEIASVTATLVSGRTYRIAVVTHLGSTVGTDTANLNLREDNAAGTEFQGAANLALSTSAAGVYYQIEADYTAVATGSKTFVAVANRGSGTGNLRREAAAIRPTLLTVEYAYG